MANTVDLHRRKGNTLNDPLLSGDLHPAAEEASGGPPEEQGGGGRGRLRQRGRGQ